jgi:hypothetical protein
MRPGTPDGETHFWLHSQPAQRMGGAPRLDGFTAWLFRLRPKGSASGKRRLYCAVFQTARALQSTSAA